MVGPAAVGGVDVVGGLPNEGTSLREGATATDDGGRRRRLIAIVAPPPPQPSSRSVGSCITLYNDARFLDSFLCEAGRGFLVVLWSLL